MLTIIKAFNQDVKNAKFFDACILPVTNTFLHLSGITGLIDGHHPELKHQHQLDVDMNLTTQPFYYKVIDSKGWARLILSKNPNDFDRNFETIFRMVQELYSYGHRNIMIPCFKMGGEFINQQLFISVLNNYYGAEQGHIPKDLHIFGLFNSTRIEIDSLPDGVELIVVPESSPKPAFRNNTPSLFNNKRPNNPYMNMGRTYTY